jgi:hypothetical protein
MLGNYYIRGIFPRSFDYTFQQAYRHDSEDNRPLGKAGIRQTDQSLLAPNQKQDNLLHSFLLSPPVSPASAS